MSDSSRLVFDDDEDDSRNKRHRPCMEDGDQATLESAEVSKPLAAQDEDKKKFKLLFGSQGSNGLGSDAGSNSQVNGVEHDEHNDEEIGLSSDDEDIMDVNMSDDRYDQENGKIEKLHGYKQSYGDLISYMSDDEDCLFPADGQMTGNFVVLNNEGNEINNRCSDKEELANNDAGCDMNTSPSCEVEREYIQSMDVTNGHAALESTNGVELLKGTEQTEVPLKWSCTTTSATVTAPKQTSDVLMGDENVGSSGQMVGEVAHKKCDRAELDSTPGVSSARDDVIVLDDDEEDNSPPLERTRKAAMSLPSPLPDSDTTVDISCSPYKSLHLLSSAAARRTVERASTQMAVVSQKNANSVYELIDLTDPSNTHPDEEQLLAHSAISSRPGCVQKHADEYDSGYEADDESSPNDDDGVGVEFEGDAFVAETLKRNLALLCSRRRSRLSSNDSSIIVIDDDDDDDNVDDDDDDDVDFDDDNDADDVCGDEIDNRVTCRKDTIETPITLNSSEVISSETSSAEPTILMPLKASVVDKALADEATTFPSYLVKRSSLELLKSAAATAATAAADDKPLSQSLFSSDSS